MALTRPGGPILSLNEPISDLVGGGGTRAEMDHAKHERAHIKPEGAHTKLFMSALGPIPGQRGPNPYLTGPILVMDHSLPALREPVLDLRQGGHKTDLAWSVLDQMGPLRNMGGSKSTLRGHTPSIGESCQTNLREAKIQVEPEGAHSRPCNARTKPGKGPCQG